MYVVDQVMHSMNQDNIDDHPFLINGLAPHFWLRYPELTLLTTSECESRVSDSRIFSLPNLGEGQGEKGSVCNRHDRRATGIKHKPCLYTATTPMHASESTEDRVGARKRCGPTVTGTCLVHCWHHSGGTSMLRSLRIRTGALSKSASLRLTTTGCVCLRRCRSDVVARSCTRDHSASPPTVPSIPPSEPAR